MSKFRQTLQDMLPAAGVLGTAYLPALALHIQAARGERKPSEDEQKTRQPESYIPQRKKKF